MLQKANLTYNRDFDQEGGTDLHNNYKEYAATSSSSTTIVENCKQKRESRCIIKIIIIFRPFSGKVSIEDANCTNSITRENLLMNDLKEEEEEGTENNYEKESLINSETLKLKKKRNKYEEKSNSGINFH